MEASSEIDMRNLCNYLNINRGKSVGSRILKKKSWLSDKDFPVALKLLEKNRMIKTFKVHGKSRVIVVCN